MSPTNHHQNQRDTIVLAPDQRKPPKRSHTRYVRTEREVISILEHDREHVAAVVLSEKHRALAVTLLASYPMLPVVESTPGEEPDAYLPTYA